MRRIPPTCALAIVLALLFPATLFAQTAVVKKNVNLRPTPSTAQDTKRLLKPPEPLTLVEPNPTEGYYHVVTSLNEDGWVWGRNIAFPPPGAGTLTPLASPPTTTITSPAGPTLPAAGTFAISHASCPPVGKRKVNGVLTKYSDKSDDGLRNMAKRHIPVDSSPKTLDLADFQKLQYDIDSAFADAHTTVTDFAPNRNALRNLATVSSTVSEGDLVQMAVYIIEVRPQGNESVNCAGADGDDIHISVGAENSSEWKGVVVEMIPQFGTLTGWDATTLGKLKAKKLEVLIVGGLTYDNHHMVNDDPTHPNGTQPKRIALWEIHPVTKFYVCEAGTCDPSDVSQWKTLVAWTKANQ